MPRFKAKPSAKTRPSKPAYKKKNKAAKSSSSSNRPKSSSQAIPKSDTAKGKQREMETDHSKHPRDGSAGLDSVAVRSNSDAEWFSDGQAPSPLQQVHSRTGNHLEARGTDLSAPFIPGLMVPSSAPLTTTSASTSSTASPTSTGVTNPMATLHHNVPLILCIVVGAVVVTATLSVGLAWLLRLACCASERKARRKRRLDRSTWSPSGLNATGNAQIAGEKTDGRSSLDSVTVKGDDDLESKDAKIDALFADSTSDGQLGGTVPVLPYADAAKAQEAPKSTWNGKGWTLFDPPVAPIQAPEPAATNPPSTGAGGGNYGAAREELADRDVGGFTWPTSVERQPSFIERLVQRHHQASELPTTAPLPYPFQAKPPQPASRMASLGGAANRAVMNMLPVTLRNAATTASRQRATRKRYHDMQPYLDSDFEGTIGGKDRELPMARRLRRTEERMAVDWTTEEESSSPLDHGAEQLGHFNSHMQFPRVQPVLIPSPMIDAAGKPQIECTPGLAGVGAAWSRRGSQQSSLVGPHVPVVVRSAAATAQMPKMIEPNRASLLPLPAMEGDRRSRLLGSVGRWLGQVCEAGEIADPYTALSPRPDRRLTKNGSLRSDYTSTTLADSASNSETQVDAQTSSSVPGRTERLLQRVDADQAEHDRQQRRLLRKARQFAPAADATEEQGKPTETTENVSRAPSIRPQFFATTDLKSWLEPAKVSTTHGLKVLEEQDAAGSVAADPFASDAESKPTVGGGKPKLRSSSSKQNLRSSVAASSRASLKSASRQKREALRSLNSTQTKKGSYGALPSACQSSAAITVVSSVFDEAFAAQLKKPDSRSKTNVVEGGAKAEAKAKADAAVQDAIRRRKMLSISSRGSLRSRTTQTTRTLSDQTGVLLSREESMRSQPSVYSELTAPSDYQFQAPLLSASAPGDMLANCAASTIDPASEDVDVAEVMLKEEEQEAKKRQDEASLKKQLKKQAKKEAKGQQRRAERELAKQTAAAAEPQVAAPSADLTEATAPKQPHAKEVKGRAASAASALHAHQRHEPVNLSSRNADADVDQLAQQMAVRRTIKKQRSISLGVARTQYALAHADVDAVQIPDSPWTSSDSDISIRRWGEPRRDDSLRLQNRASRHQLSNSAGSRVPGAAAGHDRSASRHARANSYYYGMGAGGDLRDFC